MVGLMHIIAVSGYNLTIILKASKKLLAAQSKRLSTILCYSLILIFILITGFSASIVRAVIISSLTIYASFYGREFKPVLLILFIAAGTALWNPMIFMDRRRVVLIVSSLCRRHDFVALNCRAFTVTGSGFHGSYDSRRKSSSRNDHATVVIAHVWANVVGWAIGEHCYCRVYPTSNAAECNSRPCAAAYAGWVSWLATFLLTYMLSTAQPISSLPHVFQKDIYLSGKAALELYGVVVLACTLKSCQSGVY